LARVCFISSYPPTHGRLSEYAFNLLNELQKCPFIEHIDVLASAPSEQSFKQLNNKITVHKTWDSDNPFSILRIPFKILRLKPDIVHFNVHMAVFGPSRIANFVGLCLPFFSRVMGFRTVTTLHNLLEKIDLEKVRFKNSLLNRISAFVVTKFISLASTVTLTVGSYVEPFKNKYKCKNVVRIPHGTWNNHNQNNYGGQKKRSTLLFFGHSGPHKDIELVLETFKIVHGKIPNTNLVIAGASHPNYPGYLEKYRAKTKSYDISFRGYIPEEQLSSLFEEADIVVLPYSTCTGTSGVAHLASSFGTPIIATELPEFQELSAEGCGLILSSHDPVAFAERINTVLSNPAFAKKLREQNYNFSEERTWSRVAASFCELYKRMLIGKK